MYLTLFCFCFIIKNNAKYILILGIVDCYEAGSGWGEGLCGPKTQGGLLKHFQWIGDSMQKVE